MACISRNLWTGFHIIRWNSVKITSSQCHTVNVLLFISVCHCSSGYALPVLFLSLLFPLLPYCLFPFTSAFHRPFFSYPLLLIARWHLALLSILSLPHSPLRSRCQPASIALNVDRTRWLLNNMHTYIYDAHGSRTQISESEASSHFLCEYVDSPLTSNDRFASRELI